MDNIFDNNDIYRSNTQKLISLINGHKEENYKNIQMFLRKNECIDWGLLLQLLDQNRLFGVFWGMLDDFEQYGVDVSTLILISKIAKSNIQRYEIYNEEMKRVFGKDKSIVEHCVFMKGYPLNYSVYKNAGMVNMRQFSDIDIIIDPKISDKLKELFRDCGYSIKEKPNGINITKIDELQIWTPQLSFDIHYGNPSKLKITERKTVWEIFNKNKEELFIEEIGFSIYTCNKNLQFLMTANHLFEHTQRFVNILLMDDLRWSRLIDLELLAEDLDIGETIILSKKLGWESCLHYLGELTDQLNHGEVVFENLKKVSSKIHLSVDNEENENIVQNIIMPDGSKLYWNTSLKTRVLEPRRVNYVKSLLEEKNDISDWYNLNKGGMYHKKLKKTLNQE